jgi:hypothetical protein
MIFTETVIIHVSNPQTDRLLPALALIRDVFNKTFRVKAKPFSHLYCFSIQAASFPGLFHKSSLFLPVMLTNYRTNPAIRI